MTRLIQKTKRFLSDHWEISLIRLAFVSGWVGLIVAGKTEGFQQALTITSGVVIGCSLAMVVIYYTKEKNQ